MPFYHAVPPSPDKLVVPHNGEVPKPRKLHLAVEPAVEFDVAGHHVAFVGVNLFRPHVMLEYDVTPPLRGPMFGPHLLIFEVTDDTSDEPYPTFWHDFAWPNISEARTTTRLEQRPPLEATRLHLVVRVAEPPDREGRRPWTSSLPPVAEFDIELPPGHGLPWGEAEADRATR